MEILITCEESQAVTKEFRILGHDAYSNDLQECSGGHPEWHIKADSREAVYMQKWDIIIAFPPCTDLASSGAPHFKEKIKDGRQQSSIDFFMFFANLDGKVAIENPIGIMSTKYRKPDQIVQPYFFGDPYKKSTCLWLKGLPKLKPSNIVDPEFIVYNSKKTKSGKSKYSKFGKLGKGKGKERSKTPTGLAKAMAQQWGSPL